MRLHVPVSHGDPGPVEAQSMQAASTSNKPQVEPCGSHAWLEVNRYQSNSSLEHGVCVSCEDSASQVLQRVLHAFWCQERRFVQHRLELWRRTRADVQRYGDRHSTPVGRIVLPHHLGALKRRRPAALARPAMRCRNVLVSGQMCLLESQK